jgi:hypothetical protein
MHRFVRAMLSRPGIGEMALRRGDPAARRSAGKQVRRVFRRPAATATPDMPVRKRLRVIAGGKGEVAVLNAASAVQALVPASGLHGSAQDIKQGHRFVRTIHFRTASKLRLVPNCNSIMLVGTNRR